MVGLGTVSSAFAFLHIPLFACATTKTELFYNFHSYLQQLGETTQNLENNHICGKGKVSNDPYFERATYEMIQACGEAQIKLDEFGKEVQNRDEKHRKEITAMEQKMM